MLTKQCDNINILEHTKMARIFYMKKTETQGLEDYDCPVYSIKAQMRKANRPEKLKTVTTRPRTRIVLTKY